MEQTRLQELLTKYAEGRCTDEEIALLESWYLNLNEQERSSLSESDLETAQNRLWGGLEAKTKPAIHRSLWPRVAAAACLLLGFLVGGYWLLRTPPARQNNYAGNEIKPGSNGAILTLANGKKIVLDQTKTG